MKNMIFNLLVTISLVFGFGCSKSAETTSEEKVLLPTASVSVDGMGPLESVINTGEQGGWSITKDNGKLWLGNNSDENAIRYYYAPNQDGEQRGASVRVDVSNASSKGRAGLLYGYQNSPVEYWLVVLSKDGALEIFRRDGGGLAMRSSQTVGPPKNGVYTLNIQEAGRKLTINVNGASTGNIESDSVGKGAFGVAALSTGRFGFDGFRQYSNSAMGMDQIKQNVVSPVQESGRPAANVAVPKNSPSKKPTGHAVEFSEKVVRDEGRQNFPAFTVLVPKDWKLEGYVRSAGPALFNIPYISDVTVKAPNSNFVHFYPNLEFGYNDQVNGIPMKQVFDGRFFMRMPDNLGQVWTYLANLDPERSITNINIVSEEVVPDATQYVRKAAVSLYQGAAQYNQESGFSGTRFTFDTHVRRLVIRYNYKGKSLEEILFATLSSSIVRYQNGSVKAAMWGLQHMYSIGGPVGTGFLEDPLLATIVRSRRVNPDWAYAIDLFYKNQRDIILKQGLAAIAASNNNWKNTRQTESEDVLDISFNGWKKRSGMRDTGHANSINGIHERTTYATPSGGQVNLPSYYQQAYTDGQGNYVLHNDANYQINTDSNFNQRNWQQIQPAQ
jgi:hypothetical protein